MEHPGVTRWDKRQGESKKERVTGMRIDTTSSVLITGSNRGLGLEWARQYAQEGWRVFATCRYPHDALDLHKLVQKYPKVTLHRLDVTRIEDIRSVQWELENNTIDVLVSNAGIYLDKRQSGIGSFRFDDWLRTFEVNTLGGLRVIEALIGNVAKSSRRLIVAISSHMGRLQTSRKQVTITGPVKQPSTRPWRD